MAIADSPVIGRHSAVGATGSKKHEGSLIRVDHIPKLGAINDHILHLGNQILRNGLHGERVPVDEAAFKHFPKNGMVFHRVTGERHLAAVPYLKQQAAKARGKSPPHVAAKLETMARQHEQLGAFHLAVSTDILMHRRPSAADAEVAKAKVHGEDTDEHKDESLDEQGVV